MNKKYLIFKIASLFAVLVQTVSACQKKDDPIQTSGEDVVIPELPADPQPESTSFAHRILLLQHTGTSCINCPNLMSSLKALAEDDVYAARYHHVAAHSYDEDNDPASSEAASNLSQAFCSGYYPELTFNLTRENTGTSLSVQTIKDEIDKLYKDAADAGISAAVKKTGNSLGVKVGVKAAKTGQYRIAVWVLEDGIHGRQEGAIKDWMNTHNNAVRTMAGSTLNLRIYGEKVGEVEVGQVVEKSFVIDLEEAWNVNDCKVLVLVNAAGADGRYDLVNCALCHIGETITFNYN